MPVVPRLIAITDRRIMGRRPLDAIARLADAFGPAIIVQIREKDLPTLELFRWIEALDPIFERSAATLMVNGRVDVSLCFRSVGVHLPENSLPIAHVRRLLGSTRRLGASRHTAEGARDAALEGADLVTISPVFSSPKLGADGRTLGVDGIEEAIREVAGRAAVYALGGIDTENVARVRTTGIDGVACIRAAWNPGVEKLVGAA